jgi:hypothetical protein
MKKSILLNEDEKNRILNLHETAKNLYENKKPISQIKESNSKKENMKKVIKLTESDLEKIVRRVIKESMGVGFGAEPNGLRIEKMETKEQAMVTQKAPQSNVAGKQKVDQAIVYKVQGTFPKPSKDSETGKLSFLRADDSQKYDKLVNFLLNTQYGKSIGVMDLSKITPDMPGARNMMATGDVRNNDAMNALYTAIQRIMEMGYEDSLRGLTQYGPNGENVRAMASQYLDNLGIKYSS